MIWNVIEWTDDNFGLIIDDKEENRSKRARTKINSNLVSTLPPDIPNPEAQEWEGGPADYLQKGANV